MNQTCQGPGCGNAISVKSRGLCQSHTLQQRRGLDLRPLRIPGRGFECKHAGCESPVRSLGYCGRHYRQFNKYGKTWGEGSVACSVEGCNRPECARALCEYHYFRSDRKGWRPQGSSLICRIPGCSTVSGRGEVCPKHRTQLMRFNLSVENLIRLIGDGTCNACGGRGSPNGRGPGIHHDHNCCPTAGKSCGKCVVAYLCSSCNAAAGLAGDDADRLRRLADIIDNPPFRLEGV